ncbi:MAG TPA: xanthine dehydrogenase family protein molybdopterin-binding subunit [Chloroflexota bacterium]|nr:xanthine dehydrogenase family protein molybdopterin-binding subunit [Chloroflexota bacterium]
MTPHVGQSLRRREDPRLLRGEARFAADVRRPGMLHAAILRSTHAHARLRGIDVGGALAAEGVKAILTAADDPRLDTRIPMRMSPIESMAAFLQRPLASGKVRYVGEPIAVAVAGSRAQAEDALDQIHVEYEPLPVLTDAREASQPEAAALFEENGTNVIASYTVGCGDVEAGLAEADVVLHASFQLNRHTAVPMETRGLATEWDAAREVLTMWGTAKVPFFNRSIVAGWLGLPEHSVHFVQTDVGGAFGVRGELYPEDYLIPLLAMRLRRPVMWVEDRREHLLATNHSRQQWHHASIGVKRDGTITAIQDRFWNDHGAYTRTHGATVPNNTAGYLPGPYRVPNYRSDVTCAVTNKTPTGTYRGPGRFESNFVRERLIDMAAKAIGMEPAEIRRRNFVPPTDMPYEVGTATLGRRVVYDDGHFRAHFERALERFGYEERRRGQAEARRQGKLRGIGLGFFVEKSGLPSWEAARVTVDPSGKVVLDSGIPSVGQGVETVFAQVVADVLGVSYEDVSVRYGDTDHLPFAVGAFASRGTVVGGSAVVRAAEKLRDKVLALAARELEASPEDLVLEQGAVHVKGSPDRALSLAAVAQLATPARALKAGIEPGLEALDVFELDKMTYAYGAHLVEVEVDRETGAVNVLEYQVDYDVGKALNPTLVLGQIDGGLAQGMGGALLEELAYSEDGQLQAGTFMDYLIPTAVEIPNVRLNLSEDCPSKLNPLGVKGAGEGGTVCVGAALANAVADALEADVSALPLTPERILALIH